MPGTHTLILFFEFFVRHCNSPNENLLSAFHRALEVINRIQAKLTGRDFAKNDESDDLNVEEQVERLIKEATSVENLCQLFTGWCPLW